MVKHYFVLKNLSAQITKYEDGFIVFTMLLAIKLKSITLHVYQLPFLF